MSERPISDLAEINPPLTKTPKATDVVSFVTMSDVHEGGGIRHSTNMPFGLVNSGFTRFQDGDALFAKITPCMENGKGALATNLAGAVGCGSTEFHVLRPKIDASGAYVYHLLQWRTTRQAAELHMSGSAGQQRVQTSFFHKHKVYAPNLVRQKRIASVLDVIDTTITQTEALIAKYQQIKAGLMHDLFTRGVLPNGQLRPPREQAPHLYKQTELGWLPSEWAITSAGDACSLITKGTTPAPYEMWQGGGGVRFLRVDNLTFDGSLNFEASTFRVSPATHTGSLARSRCLPGDVLTNIVGPPLGKVGLVTEETGEVNINQAIALFRPKASLSSALLLKWLTSETAKRWFLQRAKQTSGQVNLTLGMCQALPIPDIPAEEQHVLVSRLERAEDLVSVEQTKLAKLKQQKLGLMQDLLTGKVQVQAQPFA